MIGSSAGVNRSADMGVTTPPAAVAFNSALAAARRAPSRAKLTRQQLLRCLFAASSAGCAHLLGTPSLAHALAPRSSTPSTTAQSAGEFVLFRADDHSFEFMLPPGWVGVTAASDERSSPSHIIDVTACQLGSGATVRAIVDGGSRGRNYGKSLADLGSLNEVASRLVADELIRDDEAKGAVVVDFEQARPESAARIAHTAHKSGAPISDSSHRARIGSYYCSHRAHCSWPECPPPSTMNVGGLLVAR